MIDFTKVGGQGVALDDIQAIFQLRTAVGLIMQVEAALAKVQAARGIIPASAAQEIMRKASPEFAPAATISSHLAEVGHPLVAVLKTWSAHLEGGAAEWVHYGATTSDIFNTVTILQLRRAVFLMLDSMENVEGFLLRLAIEHRATPMIGRTLGRHALPITFGMKVSTWLAEQERATRRLRDWLAHNNTGIVSGAVGTYSAFGPEGMEIEAEVMRELGLGKPDTADWKGSRDRFAEFGAALAIAARTYGRIAQEVFLLQGDDIAELDEANPGIGSSTMPHKSNPTLCIEIVSRSREVSAELSPLLEWMMTIYERDSAQQGESLRRMCEGYGILLDNMKRLAARLRVHPENMRRNLLRTKGLVLAEDITFRLAKAMGKKTAHALMHGLMQRAAQSGLGMREILESEPDIAGKLQVDLADLDPTRYIGEAVRITDATIASIQARRVKTQET